MRVWSARAAHRTGGRSRRIGFSLVEILIVVVILGILAAFVVPNFSQAAQEAERTAALDQLGKIRRAIAVYYAQNRAFPEIAEGEATWAQILSGGFLREAPRNPWVPEPVSRFIIVRDSADEAFDPSVTYGWIYDGNGQVWAAGFDANDQPLPRP